MNFSEYIREVIDILKHPKCFDHPLTWVCIIVAGGIGFCLGELYGLLFINDSLS